MRHRGDGLPPPGETHLADQASRMQFLGTFADGLTTHGLLDSISEAVARGGRMVVLNHNMHSLALHRTQPRFRDLYEKADLVFIDGMAVVLLLRMLGWSVSSAQRLAVLDWVWPFFQRAAEEGWRVMHLGSDEKVTSLAVRRIRATEPGLDIVTVPGYFDATVGSAEAEAVLDEVRRMSPDVLLVGMGMPRQELWVLDHLDRLPECVIVTVGGILGFLGDERPTPPRWLGRLGAEWLFRLLTEPRRLWRRYLLEPWVLARPVAEELARRRLSRRT